MHELTFESFGNTVRITGGAASEPHYLHTVLVQGDGDWLLTRYWMGILPLSNKPELCYYVTYDDWMCLQDCYREALTACVSTVEVPPLWMVCNGFVVDHLPLAIAEEGSPFDAIRHVYQQLMAYLPPQVPEGAD